eukprot:733843-Lingulodinium_polyedra.AAC.1
MAGWRVVHWSGLFQVAAHSARSFVWCGQKAILAPRLVCGIGRRRRGDAVWHCSRSDAQGPWFRSSW